MKNFLPRIQKHLLLSFCLLMSAGLTAETSFAQTSNTSLHARISAEVSSSQRTLLPGSLHPLAQAKFESGRLAAGTKLEGISIYFSRTPGQEANLQALLAAQQNPTSPQYHQWLSPEQYASRFGMAASDIAKVQNWLEQQGFAVDSVARSRNMIRFSGNVGQVEAAFATEIHKFNVPIGGKLEQHIAPSTELSVPTALAGVVLSVRNLDDFKPKSMLRLPSNRPTAARPAFTSGSTGYIYTSPGDISTIYDVKPLNGAGFTGNGQTIAIMGQSAIVNSDIEAFQTAAGLTVKDPTSLLVPNSGNSTIYSGDEGESDLDLEWSGAMAPGANILFVYTGDNLNSGGVFDSLQYTVDNKLAQIISLSYGECEFDLGSANAAAEEIITSQAAAQGQTILAASGDQGSTACFNANSTDTTAQQEALNVNYPASSPYVTGIGGTEFNEGGNTGTYWSSNGSNDVISSALSYIPEVVWNDDPAGGGLSATGGGVSTLFPKPTWQTGVPGIPSDGKRDVPDISLDASNDHDSLLLCTSDTSNWQSGQVSSCTQGFRDSSTGALTVAGGTSFSTPIFAGMVALINQKQNYTSGAGLINPTLYTLASNATTYASAFHDITSGTNDCTAGSSYCSGMIGYSAGVGYDLTTGLGTVDLSNLADVWPASTVTLIGTTTTVTASNTAPVAGSNVTFAIAVGSSTGSTVPTGSVDLKLDGTSVGTQTLAAGVASYSTSFTTAGPHSLVVAYTGDSTHATSTGTATVNVGGVSSGTGTFKIVAGNIAVAQGNVGSSTVTITPSGGYTGTVQFSFATSNSSIANNTCPVLNNAVIAGAAAVTETLTIDTNAANCLATGALRKAHGQVMHVAGFGSSLLNSGMSNSGKLATALMLLAGLMLAGFAGRHSRRLRTFAGIIVLAIAGMAFSGCGNSNSSNSNAPKGTYTITLTGTDSVTPTITSSTTFTLTIQ